MSKKNTQAIKLLRQVQQKLEKVHGGEQARQLRASAEESYSQGEFEAALHYLNQAIALDATNPELPKFIEQVREAKIKSDELRQALRRAESAHERGDLDAARQAADEALEINSDDTQAKALYRIIHRDWVERSRQRQLESLLEAARKEIRERNLTAALNILKQAQPLDIQGAQVRALVEEVNSGRDQEQHRKELERVNREIEQALNRDDYETASLRVEEGIKQFPQDRGLLQLKALAERQRAAAERRLFVAQQIAAARQLLDSGQASTALTSLQSAVRKVPGQAELETLLAMVQERVARDQTEKAKSSIIQQARDALARHGYMEAVQILERGQVRFVDSPEIDNLLQFARDQDLKERERGAVEDATRRAQGWIAEQQYERAIQLLETTLAQTPDNQLATILQETRRRYDDHQRDLRATIAKAQHFLHDGTASKALEFLEAQPQSYGASTEFNALVDAARKQQVVEAVERQVADELDLDSQVKIIEQAQRKYPNHTNWDAMLQPVRERRKAVLASVQRARKFEREKKYQDAAREWRQLESTYRQYPNLAVEIDRLRQLQEKEDARIAAIASAKQMADQAAIAESEPEIMATQLFHPEIDQQEIADERTERDEVSNNPRPSTQSRPADSVRPAPRHLANNGRKQKGKIRAISIVVAAILVLGVLGAKMWMASGNRQKQANDTATGQLYPNANNSKQDSTPPTPDTPTPDTPTHDPPTHDTASAVPDKESIPARDGSSTRATTETGELEGEHLPAPARLLIEGATAGSEVFVDGNKTGIVGRNGTFSTNVLPGDHKIKVLSGTHGSAIITQNFSSGNALIIRGDEFKAVSPVQPAEQTEWQRTKDSRNLEEINQFLRRYPDGAYHMQAENRLEDIYWSMDHGTDTPVTMRDYLRRYPGGRYSQAANAELARLDWQAISSARDTGTLENYLRVYSSGEYHDRAFSRLDDLLWERTGRGDDAGSLRSYLQAFPSGKHVEQARKELDQVARPREVAKDIPPSPVAEPSRGSGVSTDDKTAILGVLTAYERAYEGEDLESLRRLWPDMGPQQIKGVADFFKSATSVKLTYIVVDSPRIAGNEATIDFKQQISYVMNGKFQKPTGAKVNMKLRKTNSQGTWQIDSIR